jgi:hypothetical protein
VSGAPRAAAAPLSERVCAAASVGFALWTLCCHAVVAAGGGLHALLATAGATALTGGALAARARCWRGGPEPESATGPAAPPRLALARWSGLALAAASALAWRAHGDAVVLWWCGALLLAAAAALFAWREPPRCESARAGRSLEAGLWALALACAVVALVCHRPDIDDSFYVNVAVASIDHPRAALLAGDTLLGVPGLPLHQAVYRIHSFELWNAALAWLTGIPAIYAFHWLSAALVALLVPLAHAVLLRTLAPSRWLPAVAALVWVLLTVGETHRWYGNFALVRAWQGKAAMLFVFMPLVVACALRYALRPSARGWWLLASAQVAAVGCSSTAIWLAPLGAWLGLASGLRPDGPSLGRFAVGALASLYPLGAGWLLRGDAQAYSAPMLAAHPPGEQLALALGAALGHGRLALVGVACAFGAWACCGSGLARRFAIIVPLGVWVGLLSPWWDGWIAANLTGPSYWRAMWGLPVPLLIALVLVSPLGIEARRPARALGAAASLALCAVFALAVPRFGALSASNAGPADVGLWLGRPGLKAPPVPYAWAQRLNASVAPGAHVVAPLDVGYWIPTFHAHAHPLMVRPPYLFRYRELLGEDELLQRQLMTRYTAGWLDAPDAPLVFRDGLERFHVEGVCLRVTRESERTRLILREAGFRRAVADPDHEIWVRS